MSSSHSDVNTYNQDGRIIQVEYAMKACNLGTTTIGIKLRDCTILVSEKKLVNALQSPTSIKKHFKIYDTIIAGISGISGDASTIIEKCRSICINHEKLFAEQITVENLMEDICDLALKFSEKEFEKKIFSRPFGVSLLVAAFEKGHPVLYSIDPSGSYHSYKACVVGSASEVVQSILEEQYQAFNEREDCILKTLKILKGVMKDRLTEYNVEVSLVSEKGTEMLSSEQIKKYIE
ncbi:Proteasome subunit alpha type-5 [Glugoides intestinalis]